MGGKEKKQMLDVTLFMAAVHVVFLTSPFMLLLHCKALGVFTCGLECVVLRFCSCSQTGGGSTGLPPVITAQMYCYYDCRCSHYYILPRLGRWEPCIISSHRDHLDSISVYLRRKVHTRACPCAGASDGDRGRSVKCEGCLEFVPSTLCCL